jgi:hypothetical protein
MSEAEGSGLGERDLLRGRVSMPRACPGAEGRVSFG